MNLLGRRYRSVCLAFALVVALTAARPPRAESSFADRIAGVQPKIVKIYGAGGFRGLENHQSGFLISAEGHVLTALSYVLDTDYVVVHLDDGRRFKADLVGADPRLEIAILKLEDAADLPHFELEKAVTGTAGTRVLAFSNLYGVATGNEPASVQRGVIAATTTLSARKGVFKTPYEGEVYVLDAVTNNPGAAGGALTNQRGQLLGILGKELKNAQNDTWLNYSVPIDALREAISDILAGKTRPQNDDQNLPSEWVDLAALGIVMVPEVVDSTPPFVDAVRRDSPAAAAGVERDDLILFINDVLMQSLDDLQAQCRRIERGTSIRLTVRRGDQLKVIQLGGSTVPEAKP